MERHYNAHYDVNVPGPRPSQQNAIRSRQPEIWLRQDKKG